jgi:DnaJ-class molecular chaperone
MKNPTVTCWKCKGSGIGDERVYRVESISHRKLTTSKCFPCKGTGKVPSPFKADYEDDAPVAMTVDTQFSV